MPRKLTSDAIEAYKNYLLGKERSEATIYKYMSAVLSFRSWLKNKDVTRLEAVAFKEYLLSLGLAPSTVNTRLSALNGLFDFMGWRDLKLGFLKVQRSVFRDPDRELTEAEYRRLVKTASARGGETMALLMETICSTGIRVSEVRFITVEAVRKGYFEVNLKGKLRKVKLSNKLCRKLERFLKKRKTASGEIFLSENGKSLSRRRIWAEMKKLCGHAGVKPSKVFPHNLRHLFATVYYASTRDIVKLADILGHSSINTTRIYLMTSGTEHARQLDMLGLVL